MILKKKEYSHKELLRLDGLYEICFRPLDKYYKLISFDFDFIEEDKGLVLAGIINIPFHSHRNN